VVDDVDAILHRLLVEHVVERHVAVLVGKVQGWSCLDVVSLAKVTIKNEIPAKTYARIWATTQRSAIIRII
jgi:hypothetical protein